MARTLALELEDAGFSVSCAVSFRETERPLLVLLSTALERGQAVSEHIRKKQIPVFCYGQKTSWAKNPFPRPVNTDSLISFLRDFGPGEKNETVPISEPAGLFFDPDSRYVSYRGHALDLTEKEYEILKMLYESPGIPVPKEMLKKCVFPEAGDGNIVEVYITYLRKKLDLRFDLRLIRTVRGKGYLLEAEKRGQGDGKK